MERDGQDKNIIIWLALIISAVLGGIIVLNATSSRIFSGISVLIFFICLFVGIMIKDIKKMFLCFLILIGPFNIGRYYTYDHSLNLWISINVIDPIIALLYAIWIVENAVKKDLRIDPLKDCILPLIGLLSVSIFSAVNAADKIAWFYNVSILFRGILIFFYIANNVKTTRTLKFIIALLVIGAALQSIIALLQEFKGGALGLKYFAESRNSWFQKLGDARSVYRVTGTFPSHNHFCFMYLDYLLPLFMALLLLRLSAITKIAVYIIFIMALSAFIFTLSRGGWVSYAAAALFFILSTLRTKTLNMKAIFPFFLVVCLLVIPLIFMKDIIFSRFLVNDFGAAVMRLPLIRVAFAIILSHPAAGVGAGNYLQVMHLYDITRENVTSFFFYPVHNLYLFIAAESGIFALAFFLLFLFFVSRRALRAIRSGDRFISLAALGLFSGLICAMLHGLFESFAPGNIIMLWLITGVIVSLSNMAEKSKGS